MNPNGQKLVLILAILLLTALACSVTDGLGGRVGSTKATAEAALAEAQAFATQSAGVIGTAQALATQNPSLVGTASAFITEQGPALVATAQALATQNPGMVSTAQALINEQGPALAATAEAALAQNPELLATAQAAAGQSMAGSQPAGIPLPDDYERLFGTEDTISFMTALTFQESIDFYRDQMPASGWTESEDGAFSSDNVSVLRFTRPGREALITINSDTGDGKTLVNITVGSR